MSRTFLPWSELKHRMQGNLFSLPVGPLLVVFQKDNLSVTIIPWKHNCSFCKCQPWFQWRSEIFCGRSALFAKLLQVGPFQNCAPGITQILKVSRHEPPLCWWDMKKWNVLRSEMIRHHQHNAMQTDFAEFLMLDDGWIQFQRTLEPTFHCQQGGRSLFNEMDM